MMDWDDVVDILTRDIESNGYGADRERAKELTKAMMEAVKHKDPDDIAEFLYTYCQW